MVYLIVRLHLAKIIGILPTILLITSCSSCLHRYQTRVCDKSYLHTSSLIKLKAPEGIVLPIPNDDYNIPTMNKKNVSDIEIDIRPPEND